MRCSVRLEAVILAGLGAFALTCPSAHALGGFSGAAPVSTGYCITGGLGSIVTNPCPFPGGILGARQTATDLTWLGTSMGRAIGKAAAGIEAGEKLGIAAQARLANGQVARRNQSLRNQAVSKMCLWYQQLTGTMGGVPQACASTGIGNAWLGGAGSVLNFQNGLRNLEGNWAAPDSMEALRRLDAIARSRSETGSENLFAPTSATSSAAYVSMLGQGAPQVQVPVSKMDPLSARVYEARQAVWGSRESLVTGALDHIASRHRASLPVTPWIRTAYQNLGQKPPAKISPSGLEQLVANSRFESSKWRASVATMDQAGVLRQIVLMLAADLKLSDARLNEKDRILALLAARYGDRLSGQKTNPIAGMVTANPVSPKGSAK